MSETQIHMGLGGSKHRLKRVLISLGVVVLVAVLALGAGAGVRWWQQQRELKRQATPEAVAKEATDAQNLALAGDFDKAHKTIDDALNNPKLSTQEKYDLLIQRGLTYENQKDINAAMESYQQAEAIKETMDAAQSIARMAEAKGDKQQAIAYYKKAITLIPEEDEMRDSLKKYFENKIIVLEGGQPNYE